MDRIAGHQDGIGSGSKQLAHDDARVSVRSSSYFRPGGYQVNEVLGIQRRAGLNVPIVKMFSNDERLATLESWEPPEEMSPFRSTTRRRRRF